MISSDRFGGRGTTAGSRVEIGSAGETEPGTIFPTQQQASRHSERKLLPYDVPDIDVRRPLQQRVEVGIIGRVGVGAEHRRIDIDIDGGPHVSQAAAALPVHGSVHMPAPEILSRPSRLQLPRHRHRPSQVQIQSFECGIVRPEIPHRTYRAPLKVPDINSQHSRLN